MAPGPPEVPFVTPALSLRWLPASVVPPYVAAFWLGDRPAYRLTPAVYAHLHHAADRHLARPDVSPDRAQAVLAALGRVYDALTTAYPPRLVVPWSARTPPLPELSAPPPDGEREGWRAGDPVPVQAPLVKVAPPGPGGRRSKPAGGGGCSNGFW